LLNRQLAVLAGLHVVLEGLNHLFGYTVACRMIGSYSYVLNTRDSSLRNVRTLHCEIAVHCR